MSNRISLLTITARLTLACGIVLTVLWCIASFWFPFGWDQGMFASVGDVILRGGMPYRDGWETRGPLAFLIFALAEFLFGRHMWSVRILDIPLLIAGMATLGWMTARVTSHLGGCWAALAYSFWMGYLTWFHTAEPDAWAASLIVFAVSPLFARPASPAQLLFSGVMVGCAGLIKPLYFAFLAVPLTDITRQWGVDWKGLRKSASITGMAVIPPAITVVWFGSRGALGDLIYVHLLYSSKVYSEIGSPSAGTLIRGFRQFFFTSPVLLIMPVVLIGVCSLCRKSRSTAWVVLTWTAVAMMCVAAQARFFKYHWMPLFPAIIILGAVGAHSLLALFSDKRFEWMQPIRVTAAISLGLSAYGFLRLAEVPAASVVEWLNLLAGRITTDQYYTAHTASWFVAGDTMKAARYIQERTNPTDRLAVFGNEALINFLSGRPNPTRFLTGGSMTLGGSHREIYRREYISGLQDRPPAYIVVGMAFNGTKERALHGFPELETLLREQYSLEISFGYLDLYHQNTPDRQRPAAAVSQ